MFYSPNRQGLTRVRRNYMVNVTTPRMWIRIMYTENKYKITLLQIYIVRTSPSFTRFRRAIKCGIFGRI